MAVAQFRTATRAGRGSRAGWRRSAPSRPVGAWLAGARIAWLGAGALLGLVIPYTLVVILPTNKRLWTGPSLPTAPRRARSSGAGPRSMP